MLAFDLRGGSQAVLAVFRLHIHQNQFNLLLSAQFGRKVGPWDRRGQRKVRLLLHIGLQQLPHHCLVFYN